MEAVPDVLFFTHTLRFRHPFNHDIVPASSVLPRNTIEFVAFLQAGGNLVLSVEEDSNCTVFLNENTCLSASKNGLTPFILF